MAGLSQPIPSTAQYSDSAQSTSPQLPPGEGVSVASGGAPAGGGVFGGVPVGGVDVGGGSV